LRKSGGGKPVQKSTGKTRRNNLPPGYVSHTGLLRTIALPSYCMKMCPAILLSSLCFLCGLPRPAHATLQLRPTVSLMGGYTVAQDYLGAATGTFDIRSRKYNFGASLMQKLPLGRGWFIRTGICGYRYRTNIRSDGQVAVNSSSRAALRWTIGYTALAVPLLLGKDFTTARGQAADLFIGCSAGVLMALDMDFTVKSNSASDAIRIEGTTGNDRIYTTFYPSLDAGAHYQIFRKLPRLRAGILCMLQPVRTRPAAYRGIVHDLSTGDLYPYDLRNSERYLFTGAITLSYTFGRMQPSLRKGNMFECPR